MTQALIVLLSLALGGVLVWALMRRRPESLPGLEDTIERRREELREEEAAAIEEAEERIDEAKRMDLVDWLRGFARGRDPGDR